jgi:pimeloyl-ACP methyl ester carboxylesterase
MMNTIQVGQRAVSFHEEAGDGTGQTVLMVHGATDHSWIWKNQMHGIDGRHRRIAVDLPGRIGTDGPPIDNAQDLRTFIAGFADHLQLKPFVFVGHSMGGSMALDFAAHLEDQLVGFVMVGSSPRWEFESSHIELLRKDPVKGIQVANDDFGLFSEHTSQSVRDELYQEAERVPAQTGAADLIACTTYDLEASLDKISLPALVICGDEDPGSLPGSQLCAARLRGASFEQIERCGHSIMVEQPDVLTRALNEFLDALLVVTHQQQS